MITPDEQPFRQLSAEEEDEMVDRINQSGAGIVFLGLGWSKQDRFAYRYRSRLHAVQICAGAAFDFDAGAKAIAPAWVQCRGLEWLFRLCREPRRLWKRYLVINTIFLKKLTSRVLRQRVLRKPRKTAG